MNYTKLNVMSPRKVNSRVRPLIDYLGIDESQVVLLKYTRPISFEAEPQQCFFNVWVQCNNEGGSSQCGWIIAEDPRNNFKEARFHAVWVSPTGKYIDVTPRADHEKRIMFAPDYNRQIILTQHDGSPALVTYDNVRIQQGGFITDLKEVIVVPQTEMIYKCGLAERA